MFIFSWRVYTRVSIPHYVLPRHFRLELLPFRRPVSPWSPFSDFSFGTCCSKVVKCSNSTDSLKNPFLAVKKLLLIIPTCHRCFQYLNFSGCHVTNHGIFSVVQWPSGYRVWTNSLLAISFREICGYDLDPHHPTALKSYFKRNGFKKLP